MDNTKQFSFGKNWQRFISSLTEERIKNAEKSLTSFLDLPNLKGKTFLDIGCGSGLFSYAAYRLGDIDSFSVKCCEYLRRKAGNPGNWKVLQGSILDSEFLNTLGEFDIVYAWGVLHHTGRMWEAIKNSANLVKRGGFYYIAIYNRVDGLLGSKFWLRIKKLYVSHPFIGKNILEPMYIALYFMGLIISGKNPINKIKNYSSNRGMNWRTDITDWLGGYPYEFATIEEVFKFIKNNFPYFELVNIKSTNRLGNNEYLFVRKNSF